MIHAVIILRYKVVDVGGELGNNFACPVRRSPIYDDKLLVGGGRTVLWRLQGSPECARAH